VLGSGSIGTGYRKYSFYDLGGSAEDVDRFSLSFALALAFVGSQRAIITSVEFESSDKAGKSARKCEAIPGSTVLTRCTDKPLGEPDHTNDLIGHIQYRRITGRIGYYLELSYSTDEDEVGIGLPIYFIPNDKGALTGGVRFGWRSDEHKLVGSVFVSKAFSLM